MFILEKLIVYQKAVDFGVKILKVSSNRPKTFPRSLMDQAVRASTSIALNLAEGNGRRSKADRRHFFYIARGSLYECLPLLEFFRRTGVISNSQSDQLKIDIEEISKMINALICSVGKNQTNPRRN